MNTQKRSAEFWAMIRGWLVPLGLAASSVFWLNCTSFSFDSSLIRQAYGVVAPVAATLAGFLFTAISVLTSLKDSPLLVRMMSTGHYRVMVRDTFLACAVLVASLVLTVLLMFSPSGVQPWAVSSVLGSFLLGLALCGEIGRRFWLIAKSL